MSLTSSQITNIITAGVVMLVIGAVLALILAIADKYLSVEVDPRVTEVQGMLPGYNCGACGYSGCSGLAAGLVDKTAPKVTCTPAKAEAKEKIKAYLASTPGPDGTIINVQI